MSGSRNRRAGHAFERDLRKLFRRWGWKNCETSRYASRETDDACVDLVRTAPFSVQAKYTQAINFHTELAKMPKDNNYNLVFHKRKNKGVVVGMSLDDFKEIMWACMMEGIFLSNDNTEKEEF